MKKERLIRGQYFQFTRLVGGILINPSNYLLEHGRYVVLSPLRARVVKQLRYWKWSSCPAMTGKAKPPKGLETDWIPDKK